MRVLDYLFGAKLGCDSGSANSQQWLVDWFRGGSRTASGERITPQTALACVAVKAAVTLLADTVAQLPLNVHKRLPNGTSIPDFQSQEQQLLHVQPNPETSSFIWRETLQGHLGTWGNGYSEIIRDGRQRAAVVVQRDPRPSRTKPSRREDGTLFYEVHNEHGQRESDIEARNMFHVPGFGFDGLIGYSPVSHGAEAIGASNAASRSAAELFANGLQPSGFVTLPNVLDEDAFNLARKRFNPEPTAGERHKVGLLEGGATYAATSMKPDDVQLIETRRFSVEEIARMYRIPPALLQDLINGTSYASVVELIRAFFQFTIGPWLGRWTAEINRKLLQPDQFAKFNTRAFLAGNHTERADYYLKMIRNGVMNDNEVRELEDLPSIGPDGDTYFVSRDLVPLEFAAKEPEPAKVPQPPKPPTAPPAIPDDGTGPNEPENQSPVDVPDQLRQATVDVLNAALVRMLNKEANAAKRAAGSPATMLDWLDEFYLKHEATLTDALGPPLEACRLAGVDVGTNEDFVAMHVGGSREGLLRATEVRADKLLASVSACVDGWLAGQWRRHIGLPLGEVTEEPKEGNHVQTETDK